MIKKKKKIGWGHFQFVLSGLVKGNKKKIFFLAMYKDLGRVSQIFNLCLVTDNWTFLSCHLISSIFLSKPVWN